MTAGAPRQYQAPCQACALLATARPVGDAAASCVFQLDAHDLASDGQPCAGGGSYVPRHMVWDAELRAWLASQHPAPTANREFVVGGVTIYVTGGGAVLYSVTVERSGDDWTYAVSSTSGGAEVGRIAATADPSTIAGILADVVRFALRTRGPR